MKRVERAFWVLVMAFPAIAIASSGWFLTRPSICTRTDAAKLDIARIESAIDLFKIDCGRCPTSQEGLQSLVERPANLQGWNGPYLKPPLRNDPWHGAYLYRQSIQGAGAGYWVSSNGPNGKEGDEDDITNMPKE